MRFNLKIKSRTQMRLVSTAFDILTIESYSLVEAAAR